MTISDANDLNSECDYLNAEFNRFPERERRIIREVAYAAYAEAIMAARGENLEIPHVDVIVAGVMNTCTSIAYLYPTVSRWDPTDESMWP